MTCKENWVILVNILSLWAVVQLRAGDAMELNCISGMSVHSQMNISGPEWQVAVLSSFFYSLYMLYTFLYSNSEHLFAWQNSDVESLMCCKYIERIVKLYQAAHAKTFWNPFTDLFDIFCQIILLLLFTVVGWQTQMTQ